METKIESAVRHGRRYWFVDGFTEMIMGGLLLLLGGVVFLFGMVPGELFSTQFSSLVNAVSLIKIIGIIGGILILWWVKNRFTYPRTGYVRGKRLPWGRICIFLGILALVVILKLILLAAIFSFAPFTRVWIFSLPIWLPMALGALWALLFMLAGIWMDLRRFLFVGIWVFLAGLCVGMWQLAAGVPNVPAELLQFNLWGAFPESLRIPLEETVNKVFTSIAWMTLAAGFGFFLSGGITFWLYRKENPVPFQEEA